MAAEGSAQKYVAATGLMAQVVELWTLAMAEGGLEGSTELYVEACRLELRAQQLREFVEADLNVRLNSARVVELRREAVTT
jgi:hypothetical protein